MTETPAAAQRAEDLRLLGRLDEAERIAREGLAADPSDAVLLTVLAGVLRQAGRPAAALQAAEAASAAAPQAPDPHRQRALALSALGRHEPACEASAVAVSLDPHGPITLVAHAVVLQAAGALHAASEAARWAVAVAPEEPAGHLLVADIHHALGDVRTARLAYGEVLRLEPDNAVARHDLAVLDMGRGRAGPALRGLLDAGALGPADGLPLRENVAAVLWRLSWYLRLVLFASFFLVGALGATGPEPQFVASNLARIGAAVVLVVAGLLSWRFSRRLPPQARPVITAALRADGLLAAAAILIAAGFAIHVAIVVTGYGVLVFGVFGVVVALFAVTVTADVRARRRRKRW
ncbi:MAG: hypothetical protein GEU83_00880 [Pseudonocardiaceae bacterium]|nr:hypothetical protein [Pseudonocardiaceae bacterium]